MNIRLWKSMLVFTIVLAVQVVLTSGVWASDKQSEGMALIKRAVELTDLRQSGPYHIRASLTVVDEAVGKREGTDVVTFSSTERWRRDLHMTGYDEVAVFLGHSMYRTRSLGFTPPSLRQDIAGSLRNLPETLNYKVVRVFNRKIHDVEARCVYREQKNDHPVGVTWCFDPTGLPLVQLSGDGLRRIEFSSYKPFGHKFVPGTVEVIVDGKQKGRAVIEAIDPGLTDSAHVFEPPVGATGRQWCDNMESPRLISALRVDIPPAARSGGTGLELTYELTVDEQGKVTSVIPMAASPYADRIAIETMRAWQLRPAMCDHIPVPTDMMINLGTMRY